MFTFVRKPSAHVMSPLAPAARSNSTAKKPLTSSRHRRHDARFGGAAVTPRVVAEAAERQAAAVARSIESTAQSQESPAADAAQKAPLSAGAAEALREHPESPHHLSGTGERLPASVRDEMEPLLGHDLAPVRVHTGPDAGRSARTVEARAYTVGTNIVFGQGEYQPWSAEGRRLLAHELTHVVQQAGGVPSNSPDGGWSTGSGGQGIELQRAAGKPVTIEEKISDEIALKPKSVTEVQNWRSRLEGLFRSVPLFQARPLHQRLAKGQEGDEFAKQLAAGVDATNRENMLNILKRKYLPSTGSGSEMSPPPVAAEPSTPYWEFGLVGSSVMARSIGGASLADLAKGALGSGTVLAGKEMDVTSDQSSQHG